MIEMIVEYGRLAYSRFEGTDQPNDHVRMTVSRQDPAVQWRDEIDKSSGCSMNLGYDVAKVVSRNRI